MANILHIVNGFDFAGDALRCTLELRKFSKHKHAIMITTPHPFLNDYQYHEPQCYYDHVDPEDLVTFRATLRWCDAILYQFYGPERGFNHFEYSFKRPSGFRNSNIYYDNIHDKFWASEWYTAQRPENFSMRASSHLCAEDFLKDCWFLPVMFNIDNPIYKPIYEPVPRPPCLAYSKSATLIHGIDTWYGDRLCHEKKPYLEVLADRQANASVVIDNVTEGHYGLAGLQALSQGTPAIVFNHPKTLAEIKLLSSSNPFSEVGYGFQSLKERLPVMRCTPQHERRELRTWMETYYNSRRLVVDFWDTFFDELLEK